MYVSDSFINNLLILTVYVKLVFIISIGDWILLRPVITVPKFELTGTTSNTSVSTVIVTPTIKNETYNLRHLRRTIRIIVFLFPNNVITVSTFLFLNIFSESDTRHLGLQVSFRNPRVFDTRQKLVHRHLLEKTESQVGRGSKQGTLILISVVSL